MPITVQQILIEELSETSLRSAVYDRIYDIADRLFKKYNPCDIHMRDGAICCADKIHTQYRPKSLCCTGCKYWTTNGCTVKCLPCKLHICNTFIYSYDKNGREVRNKKHRAFTDRLKRLRHIAIKAGIYTHAYFNTKSEVLRISKQRNSW